MFSTHPIQPRPLKVRNAILLFMSVVLGLGSIAVRAANEISIDTSITNAVQTIKKIIISSDGTNEGIEKLILDGENNEIKLLNSMVTDGTITKILGVDDTGKLWSSASFGGVNTGTVNNLIQQYITNNVVGDTFRSGTANNDIYNTNTNLNVKIGGLGTQPFSGRLHVESNGGDTLFLKDSTASNIIFRNNTTTGRTILGNDTNFHIASLTGNNISKPLFRVYANGNVGIGTPATLPDNKLTIGDSTTVPLNVSLGDRVGLYLGQGSSSRNSVIGHNVKMSGDSNFKVAATHATFGYRAITFGTSEGIRFYAFTGNVTAGTAISPAYQRMIISNNGNVGINTLTPTQKLEVNGNIKLSSAGRIGNTGNQVYLGTTPAYNVGIGTGGASQKLEVNGNIKLTSAGWIGAAGTNQVYLASNGSVNVADAVAGEKFNVNGKILIKGGALKFNTTAGASIEYTGYTNQIFLYNNGKVGINTNSATNTEALTISGNIRLTTGAHISTYNNANQIYLTSNGNVGIGTGNTAGHKLYINGNSNINGDAWADHWYMNSDKQLKKNILVIDNALEKILSLHGYTFNRKKDDIKSIGVIAQEVEKSFPEIVNTASDGVKSVSYSNLVAPLIEAVRALNTKITQLRDLYFNQQQQIDLLRERIEALEKNR